jgi:transcriptional regulator with XRE-family HTH domain
MTGTAVLPHHYQPMVAQRTKPPTGGTSDPNRVKYPDFAARLAAAVEKAKLTSADIKDALGVDDETVRLWLRGKRMPDDERLRILAKLVGRSPAHLRFGEKDDAVRPPAEVITDEDEMSLVVTYRRLPPYAKKALRARAAELVENFAPPDPGNPFGKKARKDGAL